MKTCSKCKQEKKLEDFPVNRSKADGRGYNCRECHKEYVNIHYVNNKEQYLRKNDVTNKRNIEYCKKLREDSGCSNCNEHRWWVLQFHHLRDKKYSISTLTRSSCSMSTLKKELRKCVILCANCHIDLHHKPS